MGTIACVACLSTCIGLASCTEGAGETDDLVDRDGDGFFPPEDCDDLSATTYPGARDYPGDGIDQDCDGWDFVDYDEDGFASLQEGGSDCDDSDPTVHPQAEEECGDGVDSDCTGDPNDGDADEDGDGYVDDACTGGMDCDDGDPGVHPGAQEDCDDSEDLDCDGVAGEDADGCCELVCDCDGVGLTCGSGSVTCNYSYNGLGQVDYMSCNYGNGVSFSCSFSISGIPDIHTGMPP